MNGDTISIIYQNIHILGQINDQMQLLSHLITAGNVRSGGCISFSGTNETSG